jgi:hypothetical protein
MLTAPAARAEAPSWSEALEKYVQNPLRSRRLLRRLEREGRGAHPPVVLLALADARLRAGSFAAAKRLFARAAAANMDAPFGTWAVLGGGWASLLSDDVPEPIVGEHGAVGTVLQGLAYAAQQRTNEARERFARVADDAQAPPTVRAAARLADAYAQYWAHEDDAGTIAAFDAALASGDGSLDDDARYGAARARLRAGDVSGALPILHALATWHVNGKPGPVSAALVALDQRALLRAGFQRYRRAPVREPETQLRLMLDGDGAALARGALRELGETVPEPRPAPRPRVVPVAAPTSPAPPAAVRAPAAAPAPAWPRPSLDAVSAWLRPLLAGAVLLAALLLAHMWWWDRRIPPGGRYGTRID